MVYLTEERTFDELRTGNNSLKARLLGGNWRGSLAALKLANYGTGTYAAIYGQTAGPELALEPMPWREFLRCLIAACAAPSMVLVKSPKT
jgi:hypothetical protein